MQCDNKLMPLKLSQHNVSFSCVRIGTVYDTSTTRQFVYSLDSSPTGFHVVNALIQLYNVQQEFRDHY